MKQKRQRQTARALFLAAGAALAAACGAATDPSAEKSAEPSLAQTINGRVIRHNFTSPVIGVRAVTDAGLAAWSRVADDGGFALAVPAGPGYRVELVTTAGSHGFVARTGGSARALLFDVCSAGAPFDVGHVHGWSQSTREQPGEGCGDPPLPCDDQGNCCTPDGDCPPPPCDPGADGGCGDPPFPPQPCDPSTGVGCCDQPNPDGSCPPPPCDPGADGGCGDLPPPPPPPCDPGADGGCGDLPPPPPPPCDPLTGVGCCDQPNPDGDCPPQPCDPGADGGCEDPPFPCDDYDDPVCWPKPEPPPCDGEPGANAGEACWADGAVPEVAIPDFGCAVSAGG